MLKQMVYSYPTLNTYTYNVAIGCIHISLYNVNLDSNNYMFQNGQPTFLFWHNIQAHVPISTKVLPKMAPFCIKIQLV